MLIHIDEGVTAGIARACAVPLSEGGIAALAPQLGALLPGLQFRLALSRGGWCRFGGVVDGGYGRVTDNIYTWAERESAGDVQALVERYGGRGWFATRLQGRTHYLVARSGPAPADFIQLEVEELQEVLDRPLIDPDWMPDDIEEFLDPLDYPRLEPEPIGQPRFVFRRVTPIAELLRQRPDLALEGMPLQRFIDDWAQSSAGASAVFCDHWVLAIRDTPDSVGGTYMSVRPVPVDAAVARPATPFEDLAGTELSLHLRSVDQAAGYPFAWYFSMLGSRRVPFEAGEAVYRDLCNGYDYLPQSDAAVLERWVEDRYAV